MTLKNDHDSLHNTSKVGSFASIPDLEANLPCDDSHAPKGGALADHIGNTLDHVRKIIGERSDNHGQTEENFRIISMIITEFLRPKLHEGEQITRLDVCNIMCALKIARMITGKSPDSRLDLIGYALLGNGFKIMDEEKDS